eukprot:1265268-Karenia_brevis.AAC.1
MAMAMAMAMTMAMTMKMMSRKENHAKSNLMGDQVRPDPTQPPIRLDYHYLVEHKGSTMEKQHVLDIDGDDDGDGDDDDEPQGAASSVFNKI